MEKDFKLVADSNKENNYDFYLDNEKIGYSVINNNDFYIEIFETFRSNGYGNRLYIETLKLIPNKEITVNIDISNYRMINIILKNGGLELANNNGIKCFLICK